MAANESMPAPARPRLLTAAAVGKLTEYTSRRVRELYRLGRFPAPIDPKLSAINWRWSPVAVEQYIAGEWHPPADLDEPSESGSPLADKLLKLVGE